LNFWFLHIAAVSFVFAEVIGRWSVMVAAPARRVNRCAPCYVSEKRLRSIRARVLTLPRCHAHAKSRSLVLAVFTGVFIPRLRSLWKRTHVSGSRAV